VSRECDRCGDDHDNKAPGGTYRDICKDCQREGAVHTRHVDQCDDPECMVCRDYHADDLVGRTDSEQATLDDV